MINVIPAIIASNIQEVQEKIKLVESYVDWIQIDVVDGIFAPNNTWNNPEELKNIETKCLIEAHLMIYNAEENIDNWVESGAKRIVVTISIEDNFHLSIVPPRLFCAYFSNCLFNIFLGNFVAGIDKPVCHFA